MVLGGGDHEFTRRMRTEEGNNMGFDELLPQFEVSFILLLFFSFWELEAGEGERNPGIKIKIVYISSQQYY